jgi:hypothetical protein
MVLHPISRRSVLASAAAAGGPLRYDRTFKDDQREMAQRELEITDASSHLEREPSKSLGASSKNFGCGAPATSRRN